MLVDAAKGGDVEIPVFCYEPKLGGPVGACRMCLVEIEGIPKLQTACSTPVRDGMVVYTAHRPRGRGPERGGRVPARQPPARLPGLRQGRRVPAAGHRASAGDRGAAGSPTRSATSASRCRSRRWSGSTASAASSATAACASARRSPRTSSCSCSSAARTSYVGTFDDRPYIAPFHGNIIELCPVGALTSEAYRFRARPWDIEDSGSICTLCPSQCNVKFTVRDERVERVLARDNHEVDNGWLCDKGRFGFQMISSEERITEPAAERQPRRLGADARDAAAKRLGAGERRIAAIVGGQASNEEAYLVQRIVRGALGSPHVTSTDELDAGAARDALGPRARRRDRRRSTRPSRCSLVGADPLQLDADPRPAPAQGGPPVGRSASWSPPSARPRSTAAPRRPRATRPATAAAFLTALAAELGGDPARRGARHAADAERLAGELRPGKTLVIWGERLGRGPRRRGGARGAARDAPRRSTARADGAGASRRPRRRQRPRRPRGRLPARRRPGLRRRPTPAATSRRSSRACSTASSTASSSCTPTRSATSPTARAGPRRCNQRPHRGRDLQLRRRLDQGRRRRPPGRGLRREGGHRHPPRRPPAAPAPRGPAPRRGAPDLAGARRARRRASATRPGSTPRPRRSPRSPPRSPSTPGSPPEEIGGTGVRWQDRARPRRGRCPTRRRSAARRPRPPRDPADRARPTGCASGPTATSGPAR